MTERIVASIDTTGKDEIMISFASVSKTGVSAGEKVLTSNIIKKIAANPDSPQIKGLTGNQQQRNEC